MSSHCIAWAWQQPLPPGQKLLLVLLGDLAGWHDGNWVCWPNYQTIIAITGHSERALRDAFKALHAARYLIVTARFAGTGRQTSNAYVLNAPPLAFQSRNRPTRGADSAPRRGQILPPREGADSAPLETPDMNKNPLSPPVRGARQRRAKSAPGSTRARTLIEDLTDDTWAK